MDNNNTNESKGRLVINCTQEQANNFFARLKRIKEITLKSYKKATETVPQERYCFTADIMEGISIVFETRANILIITAADHILSLLKGEFELAQRMQGAKPTPQEAAQPADASNKQLSAPKQEIVKQQPANVKNQASQNGKTTSQQTVQNNAKTPQNSAKTGQNNAKTPQNNVKLDLDIIAQALHQGKPQKNPQSQQVKTQNTQQNQQVKTQNTQQNQQVNAKNTQQNQQVSAKNTQQNNQPKTQNAQQNNQPKAQNNQQNQQVKTQNNQQKQGAGEKKAGLVAPKSQGDNDGLIRGVSRFKLESMLAKLSGEKNVQCVTDKNSFREGCEIYTITAGKSSVTVRYYADKFFAQLGGRVGKLLERVRGMLTTLEKVTIQESELKVAHRKLKKMLPNTFEILSEQAKTDFSIGMIDISNDNVRLSDYSMLLVPPYRGLECLISDLQKAKGIDVKMIGQAYEKLDGKYVLKSGYRKRMNSHVYCEVMSALYIEYFEKRNFYAHSDITGDSLSRIISDKETVKTIFNSLIDLVEYNIFKLKEIHFWR